MIFLLISGCWCWTEPSQSPTILERPETFDPTEKPCLGSMSGTVGEVQVSVCMVGETDFTISFIMRLRPESETLFFLPNIASTSPPLPIVDMSGYEHGSGNYTFYKFHNVKVFPIRNPMTVLSFFRKSSPSKIAYICSGSANSIDKFNYNNPELVDLDVSWGEPVEAGIISEFNCAVVDFDNFKIINENLSTAPVAPHP